MTLKKRGLVSVFLSVLLVSIIGCFPTSTDNGDDNTNPTDISDDLTGGDDPADLPTDLDPNANISENGIDSMFDVLISRVESLQNIDGPSELYGIDFSSLRRGFASAVVGQPAHSKANIGFIVSSILSLNGNVELQKMIDSLSQYVDDIDEYYSLEDPYESTDPYSLAMKKKTAAPEVKTVSFLSKTYSSHGILSAGQILMGEAPKILLAQTSRPSFPSFLTASYIQDMIESAVVPRLNEVVAATQRLTDKSNMSLEITVDNETYEIDKGDIYILEAMTRAARAGFSMALIYDMDMVPAPGSANVHWMDDIMDYMDNMNNSSGYSEMNYSLKGDTLVESYYYDYTSEMTDYVNFYQYNYKRAGFLSIRKAYHMAVYNDLKAIPPLVKSGLASIRNETDNQDNDIFPATDILDMSSEMADLSSEMIEDGFTASFAGKFSSPENLMDFISLILTEPYIFNEKIDGKSVTLKVDLSKFFTNPANALTDYWPKHAFPTGDDMYTTYTYTSNLWTLIQAAQSM